MPRKLVDAERSKAIVNHRGFRRGEPLRWLLASLDRSTDACMDWPYGTNGRGYGQVQFEGRTRSVHHVVLELSGQPRPSPDHGALHSCDRPTCVNRRHLRGGTTAENRADAVARGRQIQGSQCPRARLVEADVGSIKAALRSGARQKDIADDFHVTPQVINYIARGRTWRHVTEESHAS